MYLFCLFVCFFQVGVRCATILKKMFPSALRRQIGWNWLMSDALISCGISMPPVLCQAMGMFCFCHTTLRATTESVGHLVRSYGTPLDPGEDAALARRTRFSASFHLGGLVSMLNSGGWIGRMSGGMTICSCRFVSWRMFYRFLQFPKFCFFPFQKGL